MKQLTLLIAAGFLTMACFGQQNTYFGIEFGVSNHRFEYFDDGDRLVRIPLPDVRVGVVVGHTFGNFLSLETGIIRKNYTEGYGFNLGTFESSHLSTSIHTWQIPLRVKPKVKILSDHLFISSTIGIHYCFNQDFEFHSGGGGSAGEEVFVRHHYGVEYGLTRAFPLLETGFGIEVHLFKRASINLTAGYFTGFKPVIEMDILYNVNDGPDTMARAHSKGEYVSLYLGVLYSLTGRL